MRFNDVLPADFSFTSVPLFYLIRRGPRLVCHIPRSDQSSAYYELLKLVEYCPLQEVLSANDAKAILRDGGHETEEGELEKAPWGALPKPIPMQPGLSIALRLPLGDRRGSGPPQLQSPRKEIAQRGRDARLPARAIDQSAADFDVGDLVVGRPGTQ